MASKLSKAQKNALEYLYNVESTSFRMNYNGSDVQPYQKLVELGFAQREHITNSRFDVKTEYTLTESGLALAKQLFGSSEPVAPVADVQAEPVASDPQPVSSEYVYGCMNRPAMYGTVPDGYTRIDNAATVYQWGTVIYDCPLSREQVKDYDLHPASANTRRFQVGEFVDWCGDKCEVIAHLPYNGYITIGFGIVTCDELEWDTDMAAWIESPCIAKPPVNPVWTHKLPVAETQPRYSARKTGNSRVNVGSDLNRLKNALGRHNVAKRQHVAVTLEHKTPAAKKWRKRRNLANAVAMPVPAITGAELLQQAGILTFPVRQLTRTLETRKRAA